MNNKTSASCADKAASVEIINPSLTRSCRLHKAIYEEDSICLSEIRSLAFDGIPDNVSGNEIKPVRPIIWRLLLGFLPTSRSCWESNLREKRSQYDEWKVIHLLPIESYNTIHKNDLNAERDGERNRKYDLDKNLQHEIFKDASRTQSSLQFFALSSIANKWICNILFIYAKINPEIGYIQGMNEVVAPLLYVFGTDTNEEWKRFTEADTFFCFSAVMKSLQMLYLKNPSNPSKTGIYTQMERLSRLLRQHDPGLWQHLNSERITPDYYSFRWYTTLLSREFTIPDTIRIWDSLFSDPNRFVFLHYVCCALIISQRENLIDSDFCTCLKRLQDLPSIDVDSILKHAIHLRGKDQKIDQMMKVSSNYSTPKDIDIRIPELTTPEKITSL